MLTRMEVWNEVHGLDECFQVSLNDVDLCVRIRQAGYLIVWTPFAELYHDESKTRSYEDSAEKRELLAQERGMFLDRWGGVVEQGDPYYSPYLTLKRENFTLR
jgi:hypothetical protein